MKEAIAESTANAKLEKMNQQRLAMAIANSQQDEKTQDVQWFKDTDGPNQFAGRCVGNVGTCPASALLMAQHAKINGPTVTFQQNPDLSDLKRLTVVGDIGLRPSDAFKALGMTPITNIPLNGPTWCLDGTYSYGTNLEHGYDLKVAESYFVTHILRALTASQERANLSSSRITLLIVVSGYAVVYIITPDMFVLIDPHDMKKSCKFQTNNTENLEMAMFDVNETWKNSVSAGARDKVAIHQFGQGEFSCTFFEN
jgi:hypothetical protein